MSTEKRSRSGDSPDAIFQARSYPRKRVSIAVRLTIKSESLWHKNDQCDSARSVDSGKHAAMQRSQRARSARIQASNVSTNAREMRLGQI